MKIYYVLGKIHLFRCLSGDFVRCGVHNEVSDNLANTFPAADLFDINVNVVCQKPASITSAFCRLAAPLGFIPDRHVTDANGR